MKDQLSFQNESLHKPYEIIQLFEELSDNDITYLDIELLQVIIDFKWNNYTLNYFQKSFVLWLIFILSLLIDIGFGIKKFQLENDYAFYISRGIC